MVVGNETVEYDDVKFEPSAIKEAANLADEKKVKTITNYKDTPDIPRFITIGIDFLH